MQVIILPIHIEYNFPRRLIYNAAIPMTKPKRNTEKNPSLSIQQCDYHFIRWEKYPRFMVVSFKHEPLVNGPGVNVCHGCPPCIQPSPIGDVLVSWWEPRTYNRPTHNPQVSGIDFTFLIY